MNRRSHLPSTLLLAAILLSLFNHPSTSAQSPVGASSPGGAQQPTAQQPTPPSPPRPRRVRPSPNLNATGGQAILQQSPSLPGPIRSTPIGNPADWKLTFADEFNAAALDTAKWATEYGYDTSCGGTSNPPAYCNRSNNDEKEWYIDEAHQEAGGTLKLTATTNDCSGDALPDRSYAPYTCAKFPYLSGMISTHDRFSQLYGYFEARLKVPKGQGFWPAFWMIPQLPPAGSPAQVYWPPELDILEFKGQQEHNVFMTNIWAGSYPDPGSALNEWPWGGYSQTTYTDLNTDFSANFHTYAVDWEPDAIVWYVDGVERARETTNLPPGKTNPPDFSGGMQIILNLAVGGTFVGGLLPGVDLLPASLEVDYVRVYQKAERFRYLPAVLRDNP